MTAWTDLVKKVWNENKKKPGFKFKDALILAKKQYKGALTKKKGGSCGAMPAAKVAGGSCGAMPAAKVAGGSGCPFAKTGGSKKEKKRGGNMESEDKETGGEDKIETAPNVEEMGGEDKAPNVEEMGGEKDAPKKGFLNRVFGFGGSKKKYKKDKKNKTEKLKKGGKVVTTENGTPYFNN